MSHRPAWMKLTGILISVPLLFVAAPFSMAEAVSTGPLGSIVSTGSAVIGSSAAPTGTTIFPGDRIASESPALINLKSGSRIEITKATAHFDRNGDALLLQMDEGLLRFSFKKGEEVQIKAGDYRFTAVGDSGHTGELGMNRRGQIAMNVMEGSFKVMNTANGSRTEASVGTPFAVMDQTGRGQISSKGQTVEDTFLSLGPDELKGQCIVAGSEAYAISGNTENTITVNGSWKLKTGEYTYQVVECTEEAMMQAGASREAAKAAVVTSVFGVSPAEGGSHTARNVAIVAGVGAGVAIPLAILATRKDEKSPSSR